MDFGVSQPDAIEVSPHQVLDVIDNGLDFLDFSHFFGPFVDVFVVSVEGPWFQLATAVSDEEDVLTKFVWEAEEGCSGFGFADGCFLWSDC